MQPQQISPMAPVSPSSQPVFLRPASQFEAVRVSVLGLLVGALVPIIGQWLAAVFVRPVFCSSGNLLNICTNNAAFGYGTSVIVLGILALVVLANWQVFRPLLMVVATIISFWGLQQYFHTLETEAAWLYYALSAGLYMFTYLLFYWLMRLHNFLAGVILIGVAVVIIRLVLTQ